MNHRVCCPQWGGWELSSDCQKGWDGKWEDNGGKNLVFLSCNGCKSEWRGIQTRCAKEKPRCGDEGLPNDGRVTRLKWGQPEVETSVGQDFTIDLKEISPAISRAWDFLGWDTKNMDPWAKLMHTCVWIFKTILCAFFSLNLGPWFPSPWLPPLPSTHWIKNILLNLRVLRGLFQHSYSIEQCCV